MSERCEIRECRAEVDLVYLERGVCEKHWNELNAADAPPERLKVVLGIEADAPPAVEAEMAENNTTAAESAATEEKTMAGKKKASRKTASASKKGAGTKTAKSVKKGKAAAAKEPKPKREGPPKGNRVFAIRVTDAELAAIHRAAGPRNATRFIRQVAAAFAAEDPAAFKAVVEQAREVRG